jgi:hypothetical protein
VIVMVLALVGVIGTESSAGAATIPAPASGSPVGSLDSISPGFDDVWTVRGWAADPDATARLNVHIYVGSTPVVIAVVNRPRPDVALAAPWAGGNTGFEHPISFAGELQRYGSDQLCAYAYNQNRGSSTLLGCRRLFPPASASPHNPVGHVDSATPSQGLLRLRGWAGDRGGAASTLVRVYDNGLPLTQFSANQPRPDVQAVTGLGPNTGFDFTIPLYPGAHQICLYAENTGLGTSNTTLGCVSRTDPGKVAPGPNDPRGDLSPLRRDVCCIPGTSTMYHARGWAFDPDSSAPLQIVQRYWQLPNIPQEDIARIDRAANLPRPDVQAAYPSAGPNTGFDIDAFASHTGYLVTCVWAKNVGPGTDRLLGCSWGVWA